MRVGIIGTNWGRVHIGTFRRHGAEVHALVGLDGSATAEIAAAEGIAIGTGDLAVLDGVDLVVVATPTASHRELVERFVASKPVLCEKPLLGGPGDERFAAAIAGRPVYVNYAFPFLETARRMAARRAAMGSLARARLDARIALEGIADPAVALREVAIHPLAFLAQLLGPLERERHSRDERALSMTLRHSGGVLEVRVELGGEPGFHFDLVLEAAGGPGAENDREGHRSVRASGGYRPGAGWGFDPLWCDGAPWPGDGERSSPGRDIWFEANCAVAGALLEHLADEASGDPPEGTRLIHAARALEFERLLL